MTVRAKPVFVLCHARPSSRGPNQLSPIRSFLIDSAPRGGAHEHVVQKNFHGGGYDTERAQDASRAPHADDFSQRRAAMNAFGNRVKS
jgi:hypothetical protein